VDLNRLSRGEQIVGGASLLMLILSFLPMWAKYEVEAFGFSDSQRFSLWSDAFNFVPKLGLILLLVALGLVIARAMGANLTLPVGFGLAYVALCGVAALTTILTLLIGPREFGLGGAAGLEISRGLLLLIGWIVPLAATAGGYLHMQEETSGAGPVMPTTPAAPPTAPTTPSTPATPSDPTPPPASGTTPPAQ